MLKKEEIIYLLFKKKAEFEHKAKEASTNHDFDTAFVCGGQAEGLEEAMRIIGINPEVYNKAALVKEGDWIEMIIDTPLLPKGSRHQIKGFEIGWPFVNKGNNIIDNILLGNDQYKILFEMNNRDFDPQNNLRTMYGWNQSKVSFHQYAFPGDEVEEEMAIYFSEVVPPETCNENLIQVGEPYDHVDGQPTFSTFEKTDGRWYYRGTCYSGKTENVN